MTEEQADAQLANTKLVAIQQGNPQRIRELRKELLEKDIAAVMDCPSPSGGG